MLATKYTVSRDRDDPNAAGNHRKNLRLSLETSLRRLRTSYIDIYWVHMWDRHTPPEETMRALDDEVRAGKILYVGISDSPAWLIARANTLAQWHDWTAFAGVQVPYSLLQRDIERELLPMADALGMTVAAWSPLGGGILSGKFTGADAAGPGTRVDPATLTEHQRTVAATVQTVAAELGVTPAQVAIAWTRTRSAAIHPIIGARRLTSCWTTSAPPTWNSPGKPSRSSTAPPNLILASPPASSAIPAPGSSARRPTSRPGSRGDLAAAHLRFRRSGWRRRRPGSWRR